MEQPRSPFLNPITDSFLLKNGLPLQSGSAFGQDDRAVSCLIRENEYPSMLGWLSKYTIMSPSLSSPPVNSSTFMGKPGDEYPDGNTQSPPTDGSQQSLFKAVKWRKWSLFACSCLLQFLLQLDMASVAVALPVGPKQDYPSGKMTVFLTIPRTQRIAKDLAASQILVFTVATAYLLAQTVVQLVFSHVSHGTGRRYAYLSGVSFYIIGGIIAATSPTAKQLIGARVVQGMGAAGMFTMSAIVVVDIMQPRQRAAWSAISQAFGALGNICGPLFSGLLFKQFDWVSLFSRITPPPYLPWNDIANITPSALSSSCRLSSRVFSSWLWSLFCSHGRPGGNVLCKC